MKKIILTLLFFNMLYTAAQAQTATASQTLSIVMSDVIDIKFIANEQSTGVPLQMVFSNSEDYYRGVESSPQKLRISANKDFTVSVRASDITTNTTTNIKMPSFVYIKVPENNTSGSVGQSFSNLSYKNVSKSDVMLLKDCARGGNQTFTVQYKAIPGAMVDPGVYLVDVIFTATKF